MRKIRQLAVALVALVAMVFCATPAMAAEPGTYTITINNSSSAVTLEDQEFEAYKIFDVTYSGEAYSYTIADAFKGFTYTPKGQEKPLSGDALVEHVGTLQTGSAALNDFAEQVKAYVEEQDITASGTARGDSTNSVMIDVSSNGPGYYLVLASAQTTDGEKTTVEALAGLTTTDPTAEIDLKADAPTLKKEVQEGGTTGPWGDVADYKVGDTVPFLIHGTIPTQVSGYETYTYVIHDTLSTGLSYDADSLEVYSNEGLTELLTVGTDYTVSTAPGDGCSLHVTISSDYIKEHSGESVYVHYTATLNEGAVVFDGVNTNKAHVEFSNNPYNSNSKDQTPDDEVKVYTYQFNVFKFTKGTGDNETALAGAQFMLYTDQDCTNEVRLVSTGANAYRVATADETPLVDSITTDGSGRFTISGLDAGTYYLKELKAPDGYNALTQPIEVKIEATQNAAHDAVASVKVSYKTTSDGSFTEAVNGTVKVENKSGSLLPSTGGMGTTVFYAVGAALVVGACVAVVVRRRAAERR